MIRKKTIKSHLNSESNGKIALMYKVQFDIADNKDTVHYFVSRFLMFMVCLGHTWQYSKHGCSMRALLACKEKIPLHP